MFKRSPPFSTTGICDFTRRRAIPRDKIGQINLPTDVRDSTNNEPMKTWHGSMCQSWQSFPSLKTFSGRQILAMKFGGFGLGLLLQIGLDFSPDPQPSILQVYHPTTDHCSSPAILLLGFGRLICVAALWCPKQFLVEPRLGFSDAESLHLT